ncbi:MAG: MBL fold metallo-hydrolase [Negativicutes bacterium]|nr:MBL fold metallo-hydrolase [Negativicutes bacterium]
MSDSVYTSELLSPGVWSITQGHVRMFLIEGKERALLFDTGNPGGELAAYLVKLSQKPLTVVLSHAHGDHTGAADQFPFVYLHPADFSMLPAHSGGHFLPLVKGQSFELGDRQLESIEIPGHTPGSIALLDRAAGILFSGDTLQVGPIYMFGASASFAALLDSLDKLEELAPYYSIVYPCHNKLPVGSELIGQLRTAAQKMLAGELVGQEEQLQPGRRRWLYTDQDVSFYGPPMPAQKGKLNSMSI